MIAAILVPDGVGVRNFVLGPHLSGLTPIPNCEIWHVIPQGFLAKYRAELNGGARWESLLPYREGVIPSVLRYSLAYAQMYWADTHAMRFSRQVPLKGSQRRKALHR